MEPFWTENFGNPNALYKEGLAARNAVETARADVTKVLGAMSERNYFYRRWNGKRQFGDFWSGLCDNRRNWEVDLFKD